MNTSKKDTRCINDIFPIDKIIIFVFLIIVSCAYLPAAILSIGTKQIPLYIQIPAYLLIGALISFLFLIVKKMWYSILFTLLVFFLYSYTQSPLLPAMLAAILLLFSLGGFVSSICKGKVYLLLSLIPLLSYVGAYALTGSLIYSLIALIPIPSAMLMGVLHKKRVGRTAMIATASAVLLTLCAAFALLLLFKNGTVSVEYVRALINVARENVIYFMKNFTVDVGGTPTNIFVAEYVDMFVTHIFNLLFSVAVCASFVIIFFSHSIQMILYERTDYDLLVTEKTSKITMSIYAAGIFIICYILSLSTDVAGNPDILSAISQNLCIILTPGLFIVGLEAVGALMKKLRGLGFFLILLLMIGILALSEYILDIMAGLGAVYIIIKAIDKWAEKHYIQKHM